MTDPRLLAAIEAAKRDGRIISNQGVNIDALIGSLVSDTTRETRKFASEKELQAAVRALALECGWMFYHTHDSRRSDGGFPDCVLVRGKRMIVAELKFGKGTPSGDQKRWVGALREIEGIEVYVWWETHWDEIVKTLK